jgi:tetratricopeptide (TPR) repeat protein/TolB-like protein
MAVLAFSFWTQLAYPATPPSLAVLSLANASGDTNSAHWSGTLALLLREQLAGIRSVRVLHVSTLNFAMRESGLEEKVDLSEEQMRRVGKAAEARWVTGGRSERTGTVWRVGLKVMNVGTGKSSALLSASSSNMCQVVSALAPRLLREMGEALSGEEGRRVRAPLTESAEAAELLSRARNSVSDGQPLPAAISQMRSAVNLDPRFALPRWFLATFLLYASEPEEAFDIAKRGVELSPADADSHFILGLVYLFQDLRSLAKDELSEAARLNPDDLDAHHRLGELSLRRGSLKEAIEHLSRAAALAPYDAVTHALLAVCWGKMRDEKRALTELHLAERYDSGKDPGVPQHLAEGYGLLDDLPAALGHLEKFVKLCHECGVTSSQVAQAETQIEEVKQRLTPRFISLPAMERLTNSDLRTALQTRLSASERAIVADPLAATEAMREWAQQLTRDSRSETDRAERLLHGLARDAAVRPKDLVSHRSTAAECFQRRGNPGAGMNCHDYALLYVALARSIGLTAFYVLVDKNYQGGGYPHACAGVVFKDQALLADATCAWFGVPHQEYEFEPDIRVTALCLLQSENPEKEGMALKLCPDWALPFFVAAHELINRQKLEEARQMLEHGLKLDSRGWWAEFVQGSLAVAEQKLPDAVSHVQRCLTLNPDAPGAYFLLGTALARLGKLKEARNEFRTYLQGPTDPTLAADARDAIAYINSKEPE